MVVDGMNTFAVYDAVKESAKKARELSLPTLLEVRTYRIVDIRCPTQIRFTGQNRKSKRRRTRSD